MPLYSARRREDVSNPAPLEFLIWMQCRICRWVLKWLEHVFPLFFLSTTISFTIFFIITAPLQKHEPTFSSKIWRSYSLFRNLPWSMTCVIIWFRLIAVNLKVNTVSAWQPHCRLAFWKRTNVHLSNPISFRVFTNVRLSKVSCVLYCWSTCYRTLLDPEVYFLQAGTTSWSLW